MASLLWETSLAVLVRHQVGRLCTTKYAPFRLWETERRHLPHFLCVALLLGLPRVPVLVLLLALQLLRLLLVFPPSLRYLRLSLLRLRISLALHRVRCRYRLLCHCSVIMAVLRCRTRVRRTVLNHPKWLPLQHRSVFNFLSCSLYNSILSVPFFSSSYSSFF